MSASTRFPAALLVAAMIALVAGSNGVHAATRALLIGVSDYDDTFNLADLKGPANDVRLLREVLTDRGVTDIQVLADGVEESERPTRAAILSAFETLANDAESGDLVIIHMSGHGTRQRDRNGDEADGYDEVFLPADTARAEPGTGVIPGAIVDEEIGTAVGAIRLKGADVWFILDSCHSGSGLRAAAPSTATRFVPPEALGLSEAPLGADTGNGFAAVPTAADVIDETADGTGRLIAFYAAQSSELAREIDFNALGSDRGGDGQSSGGDGWYGLFTAKLAARLRDADAISYRQLFQAVLADMNDTALPGAARLQTPFWEGNMAEAVVLGGGDSIGIRQFALDGDEVLAGFVHGLAEGTLVSIVADATAEPGSTLAPAQLVDVTATRSVLVAVGDDCVPQAGTLCPSVGTLPASGRFARVRSKPIDFIVRFSDLRVEGLSTNDTLNASLTQAFEAVNAAGEFRFAVDADRFDIEVRARDGALWFGPATDVEGEPLGLRWDPTGPVLLRDVLTRIGRAERLASMLEAVSETASPLNPSPIGIEARLRQSPVDALDAPGATPNPRRECGRIFRNDALGAIGPLAPAAELKQCDQVSFLAKGAVRGSRDVNRIHIDAQYCIHASYERVEDQRNAIDLGSALVMCSDCPGGYSAGIERLFVLVTEAEENADQLNLEGVVENCAVATGTRNSPTEAVKAFLEGIVTQPNTRGAMGGFDLAEIWVERFQWQVVPRATVFRRAEASGGKASPE
ncbi:MAG: caspase family protein [Pseudomonadota bacterium]